MSTKPEMAEKLEAEIKKHEKFKSAVIAAVTFLGGLAGGAGAVYYQLLQKVDERIEKHLAPYNLMLTGMSLNQNQDHDIAAKVFRDALKLEGSKSLPAATQDVIYDGLIYAIQNAREPEDYSWEFKAVMKRYSNDVSMDGWRKEQVAWYLLRTGHKDEAKSLFVEAKQWYDNPEHSDPRMGTGPVLGLLRIAIVESDFTAAQTLADDLALLDPNSYERPDLIRQLRGWPKERWFPSFAHKYKSAGFDVNVGSLIEKLRAKEKEHPSTL